MDTGGRYMSDLKDDSKLYKELSEMYDAKSNKDLDLFNECVDIAERCSKREMKYVIFRLKAMDDDADTGLDIVNVPVKIIKALVGDSYKSSFIISVFEAALDEMCN